MSGTVISQIIVFAISPVLSRLYGPADFALLTLFLSISGLLATISTGRYEVAIMLPKRDEDAKRILQLSLLLAVSVSLLSLIVFVFFNSEITAYTKNERISFWLYFVPLSVLLSGTYQTFTYFLNRYGKYKQISITRGSQSFFIGLMQIVSKFITKSGLIIGNLTGHFLSVLIIIFQSVRSRKSDFTNFKRFSIRELLKIAKQYPEFPTINMFHAFSDIARDSIAIILISRYFNQEVLGYFALTIRLLKAPVIVIGSSIGQVFFKEAKTYIGNANLFNRVLKLTGVNFLMAIPVFLTLYIIAPAFFAFFFGKEWYDSGLYARYLAVFYMFNFLASPLSVIPILLRKQGKFFIFNIVRGILYIGIFGVCGLMSVSIDDTLIYLSVIMSVFISIVILWIFYISYKSDKQVLESLK